LIDFWCLTPLSAIFQIYHGDLTWVYALIPTLSVKILKAYL